MIALGNFPFGEPVRKLEQKDRTPKRVFVLGVYASAVHAKWLSPTGKTIVNALAVTSEPYIFWRGENAQDIITHIKIPKEVGKLVPAKDEFNGPSGLALDNLILKPLKLERKEAWLCDLVPYSCMNEGQEAAIRKKYSKMAETENLPPATTPHLPEPLVDSTRQNEIFTELRESKANIIILLGDQPIKWFLNRFTTQWPKLSEFGTDEKTYGSLHSIGIEGHVIKVLPLAHPRQIAKLGKSSDRWYRLHRKWIERAADIFMSA
jgi:uracil-DNA glycosylase